MANEYCRHLSNGFRFLNKNLVYQPCCWVPVSPPVNNINQLNQYREDIAAKVLANKKTYCQDCIKRENSGTSESLRQKSFLQIPEFANDGDVVDLSIQIDTTCNAACSICGPHFSSLWRKELTPITPLEDTKNQYTKLIEIIDLSKLRTLRFYGGEPLVNDNHLILLNNITNPENVNLMYSTNGSIFPNNNTISAWSKFRSVHIIFSIDDINDRFHYIRWPLSWNKVKNNIEQITNLNEVKSAGILCTINPMNILYFNQLESWFNDIKNRSTKIDKLTTTACYGTWGLDATPQFLRDKIIEKYGDTHRVVKLLDSHQLSPGKWEALLKEMETLDKRRGLSFQETFAEALLHI
jgi:molybdenum cofactor biosynthesis enzyme MoaA